MNALATQSVLKLGLSLLAAILISLPAEGQVIPDRQWSQTIVGGKFTITTDGNVAFSTSGNVGSYTPQGTLRWSTHISVGGDTPTGAQALGATLNGGVAGVSAGYIQRYSYAYRAFFRVSETGNQDVATILEQSFSGSGSVSTLQGIDDLIGTPDGRVVFLSTNTSATALTSAVVIKAGDQGWRTVINYPNPSPTNPDRTVTKGERIINTPDGGFLVVGYYNADGLVGNPLSTTAPSYGWIAKLNGQGTVQWQKLMRSFPIPISLSGGDPGAVLNTNSITDVTLMPDGSGYALAGMGFGFSSLVQAPFRTVMVEIDLDGNLKRSKVYDIEPTASYITTYTASNGQTYYAIGNTDTSVPKYDYRVFNVSTTPGAASNPASLSLVGQRTFSILDNGTGYPYPSDQLTEIGVAGDGGLVLMGTGGIIKLQTEVPQPLTLQAPLYNCATQQFTFQSTGGDGSEVTYMAIGITGWTPNRGAHLIQPYCDVQPFRLMARQASNPTAIVTYSWNYTATCPGNCTTITQPTSPTATNTTECGSPAATLGQPLTLLPPVYNCATGQINFQVTGGNGNPVEFMSVGVTGWTTNCHSAIDSPDLANDIRTPNSAVAPFTLFARQRNAAGDYIVVQYRWDAKANCGGGSRSSVETEEKALIVNVLGNPTLIDAVEVEVDNIQGEPLSVSVFNLLGQPVSAKTIAHPNMAEWVQLRVGPVAGSYVLRVSTPTRQKSVTVIRQ